MPQFESSVQKTAVAPITVAPAGLSCEAELFLGPNDATPVASSGLRPFVSSGAAQQVSFPVVMPANPGTYHVYVDLYAAGYYQAGYQSTEDVVIASPNLPFTMNITGFATQAHPQVSAQIAEIYATVSNPHNMTLTRHLRCIWAYSSDSGGDRDPEDLSIYHTTPRNWETRGQYLLEVTLGPGQSADLTSPFLYYHPDYGPSPNTPVMYSNYDFFFRIIDENNQWSNWILV